MNTAATEAVSLIVSLPAWSDLAEGQINAWVKQLKKMSRDFEVIVVSQEPRPQHDEVIQELEPKLGWLFLPKDKQSLGTGAGFRAALGVAKHPVLVHVVLNYPYESADLPRLLERLETRDDRTQQQPMLVSGCRRGIPVPRFWKLVGWLYRGFLRVLLGMPSEPLPGWLGLREHLRAWRVWLVYAVPFQDPNCGLRIYRKSALERFPIQSDDDFVFVEVTAKLTFLAAVVDEVLLTPKLDPIPKSSWADARKVFNQPKFYPPVVAEQQQESVVS